MIQQSTLDFLAQLDSNNNKAWFDENRPGYEAAKKDFEYFVAALLVANTIIIPELEGRKAKEFIFRIFRDVRFSKDKIPYKSNFGAGFGKGSKKLDTAGFYIHLQPGNKSFLAAGIWMPENLVLKSIRQEIDYNFEAFNAIISKPSFKSRCGTLDQAEKLKRPPKGYEESNPAIEFLKLKSYTAAIPFSDKDILGKDVVLKVKNAVQEMKPFVDFLNNAIG